jgi:integrase/recombinase XerD
MRTLKHLPVSEWPEADCAAFRAAYEPGDLFDGTAGPGAHLAEGTRKAIEFTYRRWLGFLKPNHPDDFVIAAAERITPQRVRGFIDHLNAEIGPSSVAVACDRLYAAARLIAPTTDWSWLRSIKARLAARALPQDRFDRLVPPWQTLDFGIELMDTALALPIEGLKQREIEYRDGLLVALLSLWPIRRRSLAALTVSRHLEFDDAGVNILLHPADTKSRRAESFRVPEQFLPYLTRYLKEVRPLLVGASVHDGFWASYQGGPLCGQKLYEIVRARMIAKFGKAMSIHDFRRAAATYLAMDAPEKLGLIPGVLQHASPDVSDQHYNLARSVQAGRRFAANLANAKNRLRPLSTKTTTIRAFHEADRPARDDVLISAGAIQRRDRGEPSCA